MKKEFIYFLHIAMGYLAELGTQYILSKEFRFTPGSEEVERFIENVRKMTLGLMKHLNNKRAASSER